MYKQLEKIYQDSFIRANTPHSFSIYTWFITPDNNYIGIKKNALEKNDCLLLEAFLQKVEEHQLTLTDTEKWWHSILFQNEQTSMRQNYPPMDTCRFIHFLFSTPFLHKEEWKEALAAFFVNKIEVVWENAVYGTIIELQSPKIDEPISFSDIVDTTASDFYSNVKLFIGNNSSFEQDLKAIYDWEKKCFQLSLKARKKSAIHTFEKAIPYLVTAQLDKELIGEIKQLFVPELANEQELQKTIKVFIENNMNVSLTAKKLFMHRNSLQYRIDKFTERTGIDIKNFQGALAVYLAIIILESEKG